jgi:uncharacterized protein (DUF4415 family)
MNDSNRRSNRYLRHPRTATRRVERRSARQVLSSLDSSVKQAVSMRLDDDAVAWLKKPGKGYQTRANRILRQRMLDEIRRA